MYGSVGHLHVKLGRLNDIKRVIQELEDVPGVIAMALVGKDGSVTDYCWVIVWTDRGAHDANANHSDLYIWHQKLLDALASAPEWQSGEIAYSIPR